MRIVARVPASSANLGPGFDTLGLALELRSEVEIRVNQPFAIRIEGEGESKLPRDQRNLVYRTMATFFKRIDQPMPSCEITLRNRIPLTGGLGSSSAALLGALLVANVAAGRPMSSTDLLSLAAALEGHPDNVAPALLGGLVVVVPDTGPEPLTISLPVPDELSAVVFVPGFSMPTRRSRAILPNYVPRRDAVFNAARAALWVSAIQTGRLDLLRIATQDRLHQPYRSRLFPALPIIVEAALAAGACGAALSGAGSAVLALAVGEHSRIGEAMQEAAERRGVTGRWFVADIARAGAEVIEEN